MNENYKIRKEKVEYADAETEIPPEGMSDRLNNVMYDIDELTDGAEELSDEIKSLLDDVRVVKNKTGEEKKDKLESLINQLEGVSKEFQITLWTIRLASVDFLENVDL